MAVFNYENDPRNWRPSRAFWLAGFLCSLSGLLMGYNLSVTSGTLIDLKNTYGLSNFTQEIIVSITTIGAVITAFLGGPLADKIGRKWSILLAALLILIGAVILALADGADLLITGRFIVGLGIGLGSSTAPLYVAECSPSEIRGKLVVGYTLFINTGVLLGALCAASFSYIPDNGWRISFGFISIPAVLQLVTFFWMPESPRWLADRGRVDEARSVMSIFRQSRAYADNEITMVQLASEAEAEEKKERGIGNFSLISMLKITRVRKALFVGCCLNFFQQATGISIVLGYAGTIFRMSGVKDNHTGLWLTVALFLALLILQSVSVLLVDRLGRRPTVILSLLFSGIMLAVIGIGFQIVGMTAPNIGNHAATNASSTYTPCYTAASCSGCIQTTDCGFCFDENVIFVRFMSSLTDLLSPGNGTCLPYNGNSPEAALIGTCGKPGAFTTNPNLVWANDFCPSQFSWLVLMGLLLFCTVYAPGMGAFPWAINTEIYPQWARSTGNGLNIAVNWGTNLISTGSFLSLSHAITRPGAFYLYAAITVIGALTFYLIFPETRGRSLEDVETLFDRPWCSCCGSEGNMSVRDPPDSGSTSRNLSVSSTYGSIREETTVKF